jgi:hypothetical protein
MLLCLQYCITTSYVYLSYLLTSADSYSEHYFTSLQPICKKKWGLKLEETFKLLLTEVELDILKHSVVAVIHLNCNFFFSISNPNYSRTPLIWMLIIQIANNLDKLGPLGKFVENSTKLTCLEIPGCQVEYNTMLWLWFRCRCIL